MSVRGWNILILLAIFIQYFVSAGPLYNYNVFFVDLQEEFHKNAVFTGWVGSLSSSLYCVASPLAVVIIPKIGFFRLTIVGIVLASAGYLSTSFIHDLEYGFLTFGLMAGLGASFVFSAAGSLLIDWFGGKEGYCRYSAVSVTGSSAGVMVFGPLLNTLSATLGWRNCLRSLSGIVLVLGLVGSLPFLKSSKSQLSQTDEVVEKKRSPDELSKSANEEQETKKPFTDERITQTEGIKGPDVMNDRNGDGSRRRLVKVFLNVEVWLWISSITFSQFGWSFVIINYSSFMDEIGLSTEQISLALVVFGAAEVAGKILFAVFGDRLPCLKLNVITACSVGGAIISGFLTLCSSLTHMIILSIIWGLCRGGIYGSCTAASTELFSAYDSPVVHTINVFGFGLGITIGSPITGALYDLSSDYKLSLFVLVASFVLSALSMALIQVKRKMQLHDRCCLRTKDENHNHTETETGCIEERPSAPRKGLSNPAYEVQV